MYNYYCSGVVMSLVFNLRLETVHIAGIGTTKKGSKDEAELENSNLTSADYSESGDLGHWRDLCHVVHLTVRLCLQITIAADGIDGSDYTL